MRGKEYLNNILRYEGKYLYVKKWKGKEKNMMKKAM